MGREYHIQAALKPAFGAVPTMLAYCEDRSILGEPFYVMERVKGLILRKNFPAQFHLDEVQTRQLCERFINTLVALHQLRPASVGLESLEKGPVYYRRQFDGWCGRYRQAKTWNVPSFEGVMAWLSRHTPDDQEHCIIHNDYRLDNIVLDADNQIVSVLDWELATAGDPLMDHGSMLAYWIEAKDPFWMRGLRRQPSHMLGMMTRREIVDYYTEKMGLKVSNWDFYAVYGLFRLAGIAQQIYYRYHHKQTCNPAFKNYWIFMHLLHRQCKKIIRQSALR